MCSRHFMEMCRTHDEQFCVNNLMTWWNERMAIGVFTEFIQVTVNFNHNLPLDFNGN